MPKSELSDSPSYPAKFFSELFGISERRIQQLAKDEIIPKSGRGRYPLVGTVKGYVHFLQTLRLSPEGVISEETLLDPVQEKARLDRERRIYQEFQTELAKGTFVPIEFAGYVLAKTSAEIAAVLDSLPSRLKKASPKLAPNTLNIIEKEITKARNIAADMIGEKFEEWVDEYENGGQKPTVKTPR